MIGIPFDSARQGLFRFSCVRFVIVYPLLAGLIFFISGCAGWLGQPTEIQYDSEATQQLMNRLMTANAGLEAFRGKGRVVVHMQGARPINSPAAWVGAEPGRLRFALRSIPAGPPVFEMSCDEVWLTALDYQEQKYFKRKVGNNSLSSFLPVSIKCADLFGLMVGRPPEVDYDAVRLAPPGSDDDGTIVILLQRRFRGTVGRIRVMSDTGEFCGVELLDIHGNRLYVARVDGMQTVDGYRLPARIMLSGPDGSIELEIQRTWPGASISENLFQIAPPQPD